MQISENQIISANNILNYKVKIKKPDILNIIKFINSHLYILNLKKNGNIIFAILSESRDETELDIYIPVVGNIINCNEFSYKYEFILNHAISIRHEGNLSNLNKSVDILKKYIKNNNYISSTRTYYVVIREGDENEENCIIDIYIGVD